MEAQRSKDESAIALYHAMGGGSSNFTPRDGRALNGRTMAQVVLDNTILPIQIIVDKTEDGGDEMESITKSIMRVFGFTVPPVIKVVDVLDGSMTIYVTTPQHIHNGDVAGQRASYLEYVINPKIRIPNKTDVRAYVQPRIKKTPSNADGHIDHVIDTRHEKPNMVLDRDSIIATVTKALKGVDYNERAFIFLAPGVDAITKFNPEFGSVNHYCKFHVAMSRQRVQIMTTRDPISLRGLDSGISFTIHSRGTYGLVTRMVNNQVMTAHIVGTPKYMELHGRGYLFIRIASDFV